MEADFSIFDMKEQDLGLESQNRRNTSISPIGSHKMSHHAIQMSADVDKMRLILPDPKMLNFCDFYPKFGHLRQTQISN